MQILPIENRTAPPTPRDRCYDCFRPKSDCICAAIPTIENKTDVLILQHIRERFHPFNTARIVRRSLRKSTLLVDHTEQLAATLRLKLRAGLLYPGPGAMLISDLPAEQRPEQLVIVDGTWHQAKTLVRDISALHDLPRYQLAPVAPSRFRIRRQPSATALSTIEATVAALRVLEPDTIGLEQLLDAFIYMVERQLAYPKTAHVWRCKERHNRTLGNIPVALLGDLSNVVVAYAESSTRERGNKRGPRSPVYWVAQRLGTDESFACAIRPQIPLSESLLRHLELTQQDFSNALSSDEACASWGDFQRPGDILAVFSPSTASLLTQITASFASCLVLKAVDFDPPQRYGTLDEWLNGEGLARAPVQHPGRSGKRLANIVAFVQYLNALGNAHRKGNAQSYRLGR